MPAAPSLASRETSSPRCWADVTGEQSPLTKAGAERLLDTVDTVDTDLLFGAFVDAARSVLRLDAKHADGAVLERAANVGGWSPELLAAVVSKDEHALTSLAIDLCELRVLGAQRRSVGEQH